MTAGRIIQLNQLLTGLHTYKMCNRVTCLTSISKSKRLNAARNNEQKWAILGTSHHDCISARNEKFFLLNRCEQNMKSMAYLAKKVYTDSWAIYIHNIWQIEIVTFTKLERYFETSRYRCQMPLQIKGFNWAEDAPNTWLGNMLTFSKFKRYF
jgi:hypothetical protein